MVPVEPPLRLGERIHSRAGNRRPDSRGRRAGRPPITLRGLQRFASRRILRDSRGARNLASRKTVAGGNEDLPAPIGCNCRYEWEKRGMSSPECEKEVSEKAVLRLLAHARFPRGRPGAAGSRHTTAEFPESGTDANKSGRRVGVGLSCSGGGVCAGNALAGSESGTASATRKLMKIGRRDGIRPTTPILPYSTSRPTRPPGNSSVPTDFGINTAEGGTT